MSQYLLIDQPAALPEALACLEPATQVALDTEFMRERTYYAGLCLVQLAVGPTVLVVDPLQVEDLSALLALLAAASREKVLHAARQDLEVLFPLTGAPLAPVFDTQVAAALLGLPAQVGYGDLVNRVLGVALEKGHARTDWSLRPLKAAQLTYAADDVRYLTPLRDELAARLDAAGRLHWLVEEMRGFEDPSLYRTEPELAWRRLKGLERLTPLQHATARALARWREERAMRRNLPRGWILPDDAIRELARDRPRSAAGLGQVASVPGGALAKLGDEMLEVIASAAPEAVDERGPPEDRPTPEQSATLKRLQQTLVTLAAQLEISAEVLATRRDLAAMMRGDRDVAPLSGWRREVVGEPLLRALGEA
ncbi:MAG: ribonuclease D [Steroidobacteraceae bacterium]|nr:ribonuclease D [Steroidobacteraceae bacterium]